MKSARRWLFGWVLPASSGILYALGLPPFHHGEVGWVALIPLLYAIEMCSFQEAFRRGYVAGLAFFGMTVWWIVNVSWGGAVALIGALAFYFAVFALFMALLNRAAASNPEDNIWINLLMGVAGAAGWTTLEWIRGNWILGGFGWNGLGVTQHATIPLVQFARYTGIYGVSAMLFFLNYSLYCTVRRFSRSMGVPGQNKRRLSWEFYAALLIPCGLFLQGIQLINDPEKPAVTRALRLAMAQGNIPQSLKFDPDEQPMVLERYQTLTTMLTTNQVDLILWPETAMTEPLLNDPETLLAVTDAAKRANASLLTGTFYLTPHTHPAEAFNAAALVDPDGKVGTVYKKIQLVPFGEYVPLRKIFPFMKWVTPITDSLERGNEFNLFQIHDIRFGVVICFEDTRPEVFRKFVVDHDGKPGAEFMVNLTNDGWFRESPAAQMQLANAVFRAIENRRWLIRCTNNGMTCVVNEFGHVVAEAEPFTVTGLTYTLMLPDNLPQTFYTKHGDVFVAGCAVVTGLFLLVAWRKRPFTVVSAA